MSLRDGLKVRVVAATARCWVEVVSDGRVVFSGILEKGSRQAFKADKRMVISLGFPAGVELTVNGHDLGSPGGRDPLRITLPSDFKALSRLRG
jgi:hypothetical protein